MLDDLRPAAPPPSATEVGAMARNPPVTAPESPLRVHLRVVLAMLRREMTTRYGRTSAGYLWALAEPCGMIFLMSLAFSALVRRPDLGQSFIVFFATGFLSFNFYRVTSDALGNVVKGNFALLRYPNVNLWDAIVARALLHTLTNCVVGTVILGVSIWHTGERVSIDVIKIAPALGAAVVLALGMGTVNAVLFHIYPTWQRVFRIVNRPLFIISGVLYTPESMPDWTRDMLAWNPLVHIISVFREGIYPVYHATLNHLEYPLGVGLVLIFFGLLLMRRFDERLTQR